MVNLVEARTAETLRAPAAEPEGEQPAAPEIIPLPGTLTETERVARLRRWPGAPNPIERFVNKVRRRAQRVNKLFLPLVAVPTLLSTLYYGFVAHDVYISESQFVVRSQQHQAGTGLGMLLQGTGLAQAGGSNEDIYSVQDFLLSRDALHKLDSQLHLKQAFGEPILDQLSRFPMLGGNDSFEHFLLYYRDHIVKTDLDTSSSILTLTVRAFTAEKAHQIDEALLRISEDFVNEMNERARHDLVSFASGDLADAEKAAKAAVLAVSNFRNAASVFDPEKQSGLQLQQIGKLQEARIAAQSEIADLVGLAKNNPQIGVLEDRVKTLTAQINAETAKVAGDPHSLSTKSADYEGAVLERDFASKRLELALASLEQARQAANRQQIYLERIEQPNRPDIAIEPKRFRNICGTLILSLIVWGIASLFAASVKEHTD